MFYRLFPTRDTFISNYDGLIATTASNAGASEILNLYQRTVTEYDALGTGSSVVQAARILSLFDITQFPASATAASSSAAFYLKMFDAHHAETLAGDYPVVITRASSSWNEGKGHDIDYYTDLGTANWYSASLSAAWASPGGDIGQYNVPQLPAPLPMQFFGYVTSSFYFYEGHEDLDANVTNIVNDWVANGRNYGFFIYIDPVLSGTELYIKKFHSRQTHFPTKRPYLEARWSDWTGSLTSGTFFVCSSGAWSGTSFPTGTIIPAGMSGSWVTSTLTPTDPTGVLTFSSKNLKPWYDRTETTVVRLSARPKDWELSTLATASSYASATALTDAYYRVVDDESGMELVPFGTGSVKYTKMSYDDQGNYFTLHVGSLPEGTVCRLDVIYQVSGTWTLSEGKHLRFRVR